MKIIKKDRIRVAENLIGGDKVIFIFTGMGTWIGLHGLFISTLSKFGYSCVVYDYPLRIVHEANASVWRGLFKDVTDGRPSKN